jgi:hypothetical protein
MLLQVVTKSMSVQTWPVRVCIFGGGMVRYVSLNVAMFVVLRPTKNGVSKWRR